MFQVLVKDFLRPEDFEESCRRSIVSIIDNHLTRRLVNCFVNPFPVRICIIACRFSISLPDEFDTWKIFLVSQIKITEGFYNSIIISMLYYIKFIRYRVSISFYYKIFQSIWYCLIYNTFIYNNSIYYTI